MQRRCRAEQGLLLPTVIQDSGADFCCYAQSTMMRLTGLLGAKLQRMYFYGKSLQEQLLVKFFFYNAEKANCCCTHQHCQWLVLLPTADKESFVDQGMWCTETLITVNRFQIFDLDPRRPRPPKAGRAVHVVSEHVFAVSFVYLCITAL